MAFGILIMIFTFILFLKMQFRKMKYRDAAFHLWNNSLLNGNKDFGLFYIANAGLFYCKVYAPTESSRNMPLLTVGSVLSGICGIVFIFTEALTHPLVIAGILIAAIGFIFSPSTFYCTNIESNLFYQNATENYLKYTNQQMVERQKIIDYCQAAENITAESLLMLFANKH